MQPPSTYLQRWFWDKLKDFGGNCLNSFLFLEESSAHHQHYGDTVTCEEQLNGTHVFKFILSIIQYWLFFHCLSRKTGWKACKSAADIRSKKLLITSWQEFNLQWNYPFPKVLDNRLCHSGQNENLIELLTFPVKPFLHDV